MIAIKNISSKQKAAAGGECLYEITIGRDTIARFTHKRSQGLGKCLERAAQAVALADAAAIEKLLDMTQPTNPPRRK